MDKQEVSPRIVGRDDELARIDGMMADRAGPWLLFVQAAGGQGKSRLLEAALERYRALGHPTSGLFDFFTDGHRTREGVLQALAGRFELVAEDPFHKHQVAYETATAKADEAGRSKALNGMETALIDAVAPRFRERRGLIVVDTVEQIASLKLSDWFFARFLPRLAPDVVVLAGGREVPKRVTRALGGRCKTLPLRGLSPEAIEQYLRQVGVDFAGDPEATAVARRVHELTDGSGQALLMALVAVGLDGGDSAIPAIAPDDLAAWTPADLRQRLVDGPIVDVTTPEGRVLMRLGHFYHGLDAAMLARLGLPGSADYNRLLAGLHDRPYVKYHPDAGVVRLHDYFADRARKLFAAYQDPDLTVRRGWSRDLVPYLEEQVRQAGEAPSPRGDRLRQQWLYHLLFADPGGDYGELWETFDQLWHTTRYDYMDVLLAMAHGVNEVWREVGRFDPVLDNLEKAARAWMLLEVWNAPRQEIVALADEILADAAAGVRRLKLTSQVAKGTALGTLGRTDEAIALLEEAFDSYNELLALVGAAEDGDPAAAESLSSEHGIATTHGIRPERYLVQNSIGVIEQQRSKFQKAHDAFEQSFNLSHDEGAALQETLEQIPDGTDKDLEQQIWDCRRWQASAANQIGRNLGYKGDLVGALNWINRGLALRREMGVPDQIAYSLAALGKLQRELNRLDDAREYFLKALNIWDEHESRGNKVAEMYIELAWVEVLGGRYNDARRLFGKANALCRKGKLVKLLPDLRAKQGQTQVRLAGRLRNRGENGWREPLEEAEKKLMEAIDRARATNQPLYAAISLAALARADEMRDRFDRIPGWNQELRAYAEEYDFGPAYADMEQVMGDVALRRARHADGGYDPAGFNEAVDHYLHMFAHLARYSKLRYREQREFLRHWLLSLPSPWREQAGRRLIDGWMAMPRDPNAGPDDPDGRPGSLAEAFPGLAPTVEFICEM